MVRAIVIDGSYKNLKLGSVFEVEYMNQYGIEVKGGSRRYLLNAFAYVDEEGRKLTQAAALARYRHGRG